MDNMVALCYLVKMGAPKANIVFSQQTKLELSPWERYHYYCRISARKIEHGSRQEITLGNGFERVKVRPSNLQESLSVEMFQSSSNVYAVKNRSFQQGTGCYSSGVGSVLGICFPTILPNREGLEKDPAEKSAVILIAPAWQTQV